MAACGLYMSYHAIAFERGRVVHARAGSAKVKVCCVGPPYPRQARASRSRRRASSRAGINVTGLYKPSALGAGSGRPTSGLQVQRATGSCLTSPAAPAVRRGRVRSAVRRGATPPLARERGVPYASATSASTNQLQCLLLLFFSRRTAPGRRRALWGLARRVS